MNFLCELLCMSSTQCDLDCVIAKHDTNIEIEKKKFDTSVYGSTSGACTVRCLCMCMRCRHTLTLFLYSVFSVYRLCLIHTGARDLVVCKYPLWASVKCESWNHLNRQKPVLDYPSKNLYVGRVLSWRTCWLALPIGYYSNTHMRGRELFFRYSMIRLFIGG